jgi:hypothetical protein
MRAAPPIGHLACSAIGGNVKAPMASDSRGESSPAIRAISSAVIIGCLSGYGGRGRPRGGA